MASVVYEDVKHPGGVELDPFGFEAQWASRIAGIGGISPSPYPAYAFRTSTIRPALGPGSILIQFFGLAASVGTLVVELRAVSSFPSAETVAIETLCISLPELAATGGTVELPLNAHRNTLYFAAGYIYEETDASARALTVHLDKEECPEVHGLEWSEGGLPPEPIKAIEDERFVRTRVSINSAPEFAKPMSQIWTRRQCVEPAYRAICTELGLAADGAPETWATAYVLQCLQSFGGIYRGARGIGFGVDGGPLVAGLAARHCKVLATKPLDPAAPGEDPGVALAALEMPAINISSQFYDHAHFSGCQLIGMPAGYASQFDFLWSIGVDRLLPPDMLRLFCASSVNVLRPGGIGVHVFLGGAGDHSGRAQASDGVERIVFDILSHHNDVAMLKFREREKMPRDRVPRPFGLVLRRGG